MVKQINDNHVDIHQCTFQGDFIKAKLNLRFPCSFFIQWGTINGKQLTQSLSKHNARNSIIEINQTLFFTSEMLWDKRESKYLRKESIVKVNLVSASKPDQIKLVGQLSIDLSEIANSVNKQIQGFEKLAYCSVDAQLKYQIRLNEIQRSDKILADLDKSTFNPQVFSIQSVSSARSSRSKQKQSRQIIRRVKSQSILRDRQNIKNYSSNPQKNYITIQQNDQKSPSTFLEQHKNTIKQIKKPANFTLPLKTLFPQRDTKIYDFKQKQSLKKVSNNEFVRIMSENFDTKKQFMKNEAKIQDLEQRMKTFIKQLEQSKVKKQMQKIQNQSKIRTILQTRVVQMQLKLKFQQTEVQLKSTQIYSLILKINEATNKFHIKEEQLQKILLENSQLKIILEDQNLQNKQKLREKDQQIQKLQQFSRERNQMINEVQERNMALQAQISVKSQRISGFEQLLIEYEDGIARIQQEPKNKQISFGNQLDQKVEETKRLYQQLQQCRELLRQQQQHTENQQGNVISQLIISQKKLKEQISNMNEQNFQLQMQLIQFQNQSLQKDRQKDTLLKDNIEILTVQNQELRNRLVSMSEQNEELKCQVQQQNANNLEQNLLQQLKSLKKQLQKVNTQVKFIILQKDKFENQSKFNLYQKKKLLRQNAELQNKVDNLQHHEVLASKKGLQNQSQRLRTFNCLGLSYDQKAFQEKIRQLQCKFKKQYALTLEDYEEKLGAIRKQSELYAAEIQGQKLLPETKHKGIQQRQTQLKQVQQPQQNPSKPHQPQLLQPQHTQQQQCKINWLHERISQLEQQLSKSKRQVQELRRDIIQVCPPMKQLQYKEEGDQLLGQQVQMQMQQSISQAGNSYCELLQHRDHAYTQEGLHYWKHDNEKRSRYEQEQNNEYQDQHDQQIYYSQHQHQHQQQHQHQLSNLNLHTNTNQDQSVSQSHHSEDHQIIITEDQYLPHKILLSNKRKKSMCKYPKIMNRNQNIDSSMRQQQQDINDHVANEQRAQSGRQSERGNSTKKIDIQDVGEMSRVQGSRTNPGQQKQIIDIQCVQLVFLQTKQNEHQMGSSGVMINQQYGQKLMKVIQFQGKIFQLQTINSQLQKKLKQNQNSFIYWNQKSQNKIQQLQQKISELDEDFKLKDTIMTEMQQDIQQSHKLKFQLSQMFQLKSQLQNLLKSADQRTNQLQQTVHELKRTLQSNDEAANFMSRSQQSNRMRQELLQTEHLRQQNMLLEQQYQDKLAQVQHTVRYLQRINNQLEQQVGLLNEDVRIARDWIMQVQSQRSSGEQLRLRLEKQLTQAKYLIQALQQQLRKQKQKTGMSVQGNLLDKQVQLHRQSSQIGQRSNSLIMSSTSKTRQLQLPQMWGIAQNNEQAHQTSDMSESSGRQSYVVQNQWQEQTLTYSQSAQFTNKKVGSQPRYCRLNPVTQSSNQSSSYQKELNLNYNRDQLQLLRGQLINQNKQHQSLKIIYDELKRQHQIMQGNYQRANLYKDNLKGQDQNNKIKRLQEQLKQLRNSLEYTIIQYEDYKSVHQNQVNQWIIDKEQGYYHTANNQSDNKQHNRTIFKLNQKITQLYQNIAQQKVRSLKQLTLINDGIISSLNQKIQETAQKQPKLNETRNLLTQRISELTRIQNELKKLNIGLNEKTRQLDEKILILQEQKQDLSQQLYVNLTLMKQSSDQIRQLKQTVLNHQNKINDLQMKKSQIKNSAEQSYLQFNSCKSKLAQCEEQIQIITNSVIQKQNFIEQLQKQLQDSISKNFVLNSYIQSKDAQNGSKLNQLYLRDRRSEVQIQTLIQKLEKVQFELNQTKLQQSQFILQIQHLQSLLRQSKSKEQKNSSQNITIINELEQFRLQIQQPGCSLKRFLEIYGQKYLVQISFNDEISRKSEQLLIVIQRLNIKQSVMKQNLEMLEQQSRDIFSLFKEKQVKYQNLSKYASCIQEQNQRLRLYVSKLKQMTPNKDMSRSTEGWVSRIDLQPFNQQRQSNQDQRLSVQPGKNQQQFYMNKQYFEERTIENQEWAIQEKNLKLNQIQAQNYRLKRQIQQLQMNQMNQTKTLAPIEHLTAQLPTEMQLLRNTLNQNKHQISNLQEKLTQKQLQNISLKEENNKQVQINKKQDDNHKQTKNINQICYLLKQLLSRRYLQKQGENIVRLLINKNKQLQSCMGCFPQQTNNQIQQKTRAVSRQILKIKSAIVKSPLNSMEQKSKIIKYIKNCQNIVKELIRTVEQLKDSQIA